MILKHSYNGMKTGWSLPAQMRGNNSNCCRRRNHVRGFQWSPLVITNKSVICVIGCGTDITPPCQGFKSQQDGTRKRSASDIQFPVFVTKHDTFNGISPTRVNSWGANSHLKGKNNQNIQRKRSFQPREIFKVHLKLKSQRVKGVELWGHITHVF